MNSDDHFSLCFIFKSLKLYLYCNNIVKCLQTYTMKDEKKFPLLSQYFKIKGQPFMSNLKVRSIIMLFGQMTINSCRLFTIKEMSLPLCITVVPMPRNANR